MPLYRLIADHGHAFDDFTADDHEAAETLAREMSEHAPTAKSTGYRLEVEHDGTWQTVVAWVPQRVADYPGGLDKTVPPPKH